MFLENYEILILSFRQMSFFSLRNPIMKYFSKSVLSLMIGRKTHLQIRTPLPKSKKSALHGKKHRVFWGLAEKSGSLRKNTIFIKENESIRSKSQKFSPAARYIKESLFKSIDNHLSKSEFS